MFFLGHYFIETPSGRRKRCNRILIFLKERRTAKWLFAFLFSFDNFFQHSLSEFRECWKKLSRQNSKFLKFSQTNSENPKVQRKFTFPDKRCHHCRGPPRKFEGLMPEIFSLKSEPSSNYIHFFGGTKMSCYGKTKFFKEKFSIPESTFQVIALESVIGSSSEEVRT